MRWISTTCARATLRQEALALRPAVSNADQADSDADAAGNACDTDDDNDAVSDGSDNCALIANVDQTDITVQRAAGVVSNSALDSN